MAKNLTYKKSGVDISKADEFVSNIKKFVTVDKLARVGAFGSLFDFSCQMKNYKNPVFVSSTDGVGTKLCVAQSLGIHNSVGIDLVAMNVNDVLCLGAKPLFFLDYIACGKVKPSVLTQVVSGIHEGLTQSDCALLGGETAEMPGMYGAGEYDLAGFCVGIVDKSRIIDGKSMKKGDLIIGLESSGLHSNGFSLVRKALGIKGIKKYAKDVLKPTRIYVKPVLSLLSAMSHLPSAIKGIAHVTGGGFYSKATKILPKGLGMVVDRKAWELPNIFKIVQEQGNISDKEMYTVFNMGLGMFLVVDKKYSKNILRNLSCHKEFKSTIVGEVVESSTSMNLV